MSMDWIVNIVAFLNRIGIPVEERNLDNSCFLPGVAIEFGKLILDRSKLKYPGDLLHEAGHIAVMTAEERRSCSGNLLEHISSSTLDGYELSAIAWSYAAAHYLKMPVDMLFHPYGYKGDSRMLIDNFTSGNYLFTPLLQYYGLCKLKYVDHEEDYYPTMIQWLRN